MSDELAKPRAAHGARPGLAEFAPAGANKIGIIFCGGAPQGGFSCPFGAIHLLYVTKNTSRAACVEVGACAR